MTGMVAILLQFLYVFYWSWARTEIPNFDLESTWQMGHKSHSFFSRRLFSRLKLAASILWIYEVYSKWFAFASSQQNSYKGAAENTSSLFRKH